MPKGDNTALKGRATAFRIWRAAESVNWDCTAKEVAEELGLTPETIHKTCKAKGWKLKPDVVGWGTEGAALGIDHYIKRVRRRQA